MSALLFATILGRRVHFDRVQTAADVSAVALARAQGHPVSCGAVLSDLFAVDTAGVVGIKSDELWECIDDIDIISSGNVHLTPAESRCDFIFIFLLFFFCVGGGCFSSQEDGMADTAVLHREWLCKVGRAHALFLTFCSVLSLSVRVSVCVPGHGTKTSDGRVSSVAALLPLLLTAVQDSSLTVEDIVVSCVLTARLPLFCVCMCVCCG